MQLRDAIKVLDSDAHARDPDVEIKPEFKDPLINALNKACAGSKDMLFLDYAALVAQKVKIAP